MEIDLDNLLAKCKAATPGPWRIVSQAGSCMITAMLAPGEFGCVTHLRNNAEFISSMDPAVAAELVRRLKNEAASNQEWHEKTAWIQDEFNSGALSVKSLGKHRADVMREEIMRLRSELAEQPRAGVVTNEREALHEEIEDLRHQLDELASSAIYRGNSVAYIYQKKDAYRKCIDDAWKALSAAGFPADGNTPLPAMIERAALSRANGAEHRDAWHSAEAALTDAGMPLIDGESLSDAIERVKHEREQCAAEVHRLRAELASIREDLNDARSNWEAAVEYGRERDAELAECRKDAERMHDALKEAAHELLALALEAETGIKPSDDLMAAAMKLAKSKLPNDTPLGKMLMALQAASGKGGAE